MSGTITAMLANKSTAILGGTLVILSAGSLLVAFGRGPKSNSVEESQKALHADVKRVVSGHKIKLDTDNPDDEYLVYSGIRSPYPHEPLYEAAKKRNAELVEGKRVRLRADDSERDSEGRRSCYVFAGESFVNETLVREGLAYVRLTPETTRFQNRLLTAQAEARKHARGIWKGISGSKEASYSGDSKYGTFHRPSCEDSAKIKPDRWVAIKTRNQAFDAGFAPCTKCNP